MAETLRDLDIKYLWHPCTDINKLEQMAFPIIERAQGVYLYETGGRPLLDGIASWWCVNLGHSHPRLIEAIQKQAPQLQHAILGGMSHPNAIRLAERLAQITPGNLQHSFFCSDGASAVEAALKISVQYWANTGEKGRYRFIGLEEGYHGDTLGVMGVGYVEAFHRDYQNVVRPAYHARSPHCLDCPYGKTPDSCGIECFYSMEDIIHEHHREVAAVVVEPLCQAAAGIRIYPEAYLQRLRRLCDKYNLLLIADEIAVGFGRTGVMFACEKAGIVPDIMTVGKGITGGYLPLSAAVVNDRIYQSFRNKEEKRDNTFQHSHTFGGNPIITGLALAALDVYRDEKVLEQCQPRITQLAAGMAGISALLKGSKWRALGMMGVVEIADEIADDKAIPGTGASLAATIVRKCYEFGLFLRPRGRAIYLWPPLTITEAELGQMISIIMQAVQAA